MIPVTIAIFSKIRYNVKTIAYLIEMQDSFPDR